MIIESLNPGELKPDHWDAWSHWQSSNDELDSAYFHPSFAQCVAGVRDDVEVAVINDGGEFVGFFPFQRRGKNMAKPLGGRVSDYQGVIGKNGLVLCPKQLVRSCKLSVWDFDHLLVSQSSFREFHDETDSSPYMDLAGGFDAFKQSLGKSGLDELKQTERKTRKLEREVGPVRLEFASASASLLDKLVQWKTRQYVGTKATNIFSFPWTVKLLHKLLAHNTPEFSGVLSVLFASDTPVALHMGMRCRDNLHWWFPTYDPEFAKYSVGRILLLQLAQQSPAEGIHKIDLGRGLVPYKKRVMSGETLVAQGSVDLRTISRALRQGWQQTRGWARNSPLATPVRAPARVLYRIGEWFDFR